MKKKSNKLTFLELDDPSKKQLCHEKGCSNAGEYMAPKSPNSNEKYFFCHDHIKLYNKRWNFFAGKSQKQIYDFQKNDFFEGRPTRPFSQGYGSKIKFEFKYDLDHEKIKFKRRNKFIFNNNKKNNSKILKALEIFSLGMFADLAACTADLNLGLVFGSLDPNFAATVISFVSFVNILDLSLSARPFLCLIPAQ